MIDKSSSFNRLPLVYGPYSKNSCDSFIISEFKIQKVKYKSMKLKLQSLWDYNGNIHVNNEKVDYDYWKIQSE